MPRRPTGQPTGRPPGKDYPVARTMLLTEEDHAVLQRLAAAWDCSNAEAVRRMIRAEGKKLDRAARRREGRDCAAKDEGVGVMEVFSLRAAALLKPARA